jgi:hypothetical protein
VYFVVALLLILIAGAIVAKAAAELDNALVRRSTDFPGDLAGAINDALLAVIVLEIFRTIKTSLEGKGSLKAAPFLVVGVVASIRRVLTIGAQLSFDASRRGVPGQSTPLINRLTIELMVDTSIVVLFIIALVLVKRYELDDDAQEGAVT